MYKYQLRKGGRKAVCPQCGQRRFVPYVLSEDNATIVNPTWGRCDRESSCGYWVKPNGNAVVPEAAIVEPVEPIRWRSIIDQTVQNSLKPYAIWLLGPDKAVNAFERYNVTTFFGGWCVFWQLAADRTIRAGKAIKYVDGHRDKTAVPPVRWMHKERSLRQYFTGEALEQCFFGEHLLTDGCKVAVVESEKTALLMSELLPEYVWLASGGSCNLQNPEKNKVLDGHDVTVFPDNGMFIKWRQIALPKGWTVDETCLPQREGMKQGYDILDIAELARLNAEGRVEL